MREVRFSGAVVQRSGCRSESSQYSNRVSIFPYVDKRQASRDDEMYAGSRKCLLLRWHPVPMLSSVFQSFESGRIPSSVSSPWPVMTHISNRHAAVGPKQHTKKSKQSTDEEVSLTSEVKSLPRKVHAPPNPEQNPTTQLPASPPQSLSLSTHLPLTDKNGSPSIRLQRSRIPRRDWR